MRSFLLALLPIVARRPGPRRPPFALAEERVGAVHAQNRAVKAIARLEKGGMTVNPNW